MTRKKVLGALLAGFFAAAELSFCAVSAEPATQSTQQSAAQPGDNSGDQSASKKDKVPASLDADTITYDMKTGEMVATTNVLMKRGDAKVTGARATYNTNTMAGLVEGNVIAVRGDMRVTCDLLRSDGQEHMQAVGKVHGTQLDRSFTGEQVDYYPNQNDYVKIAAGGTISSKDGTFTADYMEGWLKEEHYVGIGNAHLVSPPRDLEAGGDRVDYFGKTTNKVVLTGHAWAVQDNNTVHSNVLTLYLAPDGQAKVAQ